MAEYPTYSGKSDITSSTWGSAWNPSGGQIQIRSTDVTEHLEVGRNIFVVDNTMTLNYANRRYFGLMKMELEVEGFLRG